MGVDAYGRVTNVQTRGSALDGCTSINASFSCASGSTLNPSFSAFSQGVLPQTNSPNVSTHRWGRDLYRHHSRRVSHHRERKLPRQRQHHDHTSVADMVHACQRPHSNHIHVRLPDTGLFGYRQYLSTAAMASLAVGDTVNVAVFQDSGAPSLSTCSTSPWPSFLRAGISHALFRRPPASPTGVPPSRAWGPPPRAPFSPPLPT